MIAIVDYKMGNLASVRKALEYIHRECVITDDPSVIARADALILPGVGAYAPAMEALCAKGLDAVVKEFAASGKPMLGICLGMQLMLSESEEGAGPDGNIKGLGLIPGSVKKFPSDKTVEQGLKVPQIGWNRLTDVTGSLLRDGDYVYFVHSYYAADCEDSLIAICDYGAPITAAVQMGNVYGCQFHPEKSGSVGLKILRAFCFEEEKA